MRPTGPSRSERHGRPLRWSRSTTSGPRSWRRTARSIRGPGWIGAGRGAARRREPEPRAAADRAQPRLRPAHALVAAVCEITSEQPRNLAKTSPGDYKARFEPRFGPASGVSGTELARKG